MQGIPVYHFVAPKTLFANGTDYPPNEGFCPCRQSGLLDVGSCRHGEYLCTDREFIHTETLNNCSEFLCF